MKTKKNCIFAKNFIFVGFNYNSMDKKLLLSVLISKENDFFRQTLDKSDENYIYDEQINAARKILLQLASNALRKNHVMLLAPMQSGKTATCISVVNIIEKSKLYKNMCINKYFFISGMNDCGLKEQTLERLKHQAFTVNNTNVCSNCRQIKNLKDFRYFVLKNSDLNNFEYSIDNSVIFIDESHYGSNKNNILTKFLIKHGIDWKNTNELIKRNIYIVSVSATPFDELVSDRIEAKDAIELETSPNYVGISSYFKKDVIYDAEKDDIQEEGAIFDYIMDAEWRMDDNNEKGIVFIRTRNFNIIEKNDYVKKTFDIYEMYANGNKICYDTLAEKMKLLYENKNITTTKPLLVLVKGAFRAGMTIDQKYKDIIYMVYDYSTNAETTAQALLGRLCGYRENLDEISKTYFYVNKKLANMYSLWEQDFSNRELVPANKTVYSWIDNGYVGDDVIFGSRPCGNFTINLTDDEIKNIYKLKTHKKNRREKMQTIFDSLLKKHGFEIKYDYINEIHISGKNHYAKSSQEKRFNSFSQDSLVFQFRPEKIKQFMDDTKRDYLTKEDIGKRCVSIVLDTNIDDNLNITGNRRLLIYYVEVGQKKLVYSRKGQYKEHKDTELLTDKK